MYPEPEIFYQMAPCNSVPRVCRRYHYQHNPPPSQPTEFAAELRRRLRGVDKRRGFWDKVKSVAWRITCEYMSFLRELRVDDADNIRKVKKDARPLRRPHFPVAAPPTPVPSVHEFAPDIHITPAGCPDYLLSPPEPQEDGFLIVPIRTYRSRPRRQERLPPSPSPPSGPRPAPRPRPLPTPPGRPSSPIPKILCCPWADSPSEESSPTTTLADSDDDSDDGSAEARFFTEVAPFLFLAIKEDDSEDDDESQVPDSPDSSNDAASSDKVTGPEDDTMTLDKTMAEAVQDVAADAEFLEEVGLTPQSFTALLDGTDIQWSEDQVDRD